MTIIILTKDHLESICLFLGSAQPASKSDCFCPCVRLFQLALLEGSRQCRRLSFSMLTLLTNIRSGYFGRMVTIPRMVTL